MKRLIGLCIIAALLPLATFAGQGKTEKDEKIEIRITTDKNGKVEISGLNNKSLKKLEKDINTALKDVTIKVDDGKEKHEIHFKAELKLD